MNILIDNAGFINKGAELMLYAVRDKASELFPSSKFVVRPEAAGISHDKIVHKGFYLLANPAMRGLLIPDKHFHHHFIQPSNIDLVLDAGGFQFSDQWVRVYSKVYNAKLREYYKALKAGGTKIAFLPQALGPFSLPLAIERIKDAFGYADVFYAREQASYDYMISLFGHHPKLKLCPDFTITYKPNVPLGNLLPSGKYIGIVPNQKMITHTASEVSGKYLGFMIELCKRLVDNGHQIILINHEGWGDFIVIDTIKRALATDVIALNNLTADEIKTIIGRLKVLVSSRFHGAVSGLSQNVLTFCTGWSHKYQELLKDYGIPQNLLDIADLDGSYNKITVAIATAGNSFHSPHEMVSTQIKKVNQLWEDIKRLAF